jgi:hypothetical protein
MFYITGGKGFQITFPNNFTISVQFGPHNHRSNRDLMDPYASTNESMESPDAEVAAWDGNGEWLKLGESDTVIGWQTPDQVLTLMNEIAAMEDIT